MACPRLYRGYGVQLGSNRFDYSFNLLRCIRKTKLVVYNTGNGVSELILSRNALVPQW